MENFRTRRRTILSLLWLVVVAFGHRADALASTSPPKAGLNALMPSGRLSSTEPLRGDWECANTRLQEKACCVVSVSDLQPHHRILQEVLVKEGPGDVDLRARIQTSQPQGVSLEDCRHVLTSVMTNSDIQYNKGDPKDSIDVASLALHELALGMASMAKGCGCGLPSSCIENEEQNGKMGIDVHCRIVCASNYQAREPPFHTDKAPLRGYVTLKGLGTEYMMRPCNPIEYLALRVLGDDAPTSTSNGLRQAKEMEFIVMKGDYYHQRDRSSAATLMETLWTRATACVHRSPPNEEGNSNRRRVIISFDLADGDDDREWFQADKKREWRNGLTQRKSRLVA